MLKLGEKQRLTIIQTESFGVYLAEFMPKKGDDPARIEKVLLPAKQVPKDFGIGDSLEVFLYRDSQDRLIATVHTPEPFFPGDWKRICFSPIKSRQDVYRPVTRFWQPCISIRAADWQQPCGCIRI